MLSSLLKLLGGTVFSEPTGSHLPGWPYDHVDAKDLEKILKKRK